MGFITYYNNKLKKKYNIQNMNSQFICINNVFIRLFTNYLIKYVPGTYKCKILWRTYCKL